MSAQGLNSSSYNGFYFSPPGTGTTGGYTGLTFGAGIPAGIPTRDASDYTRRLKQAAVYKEYRGTGATLGSRNAYNDSFIVPVDYTVTQSNENRLTYQFGEVLCYGATGCSGPFPENQLGT